MQRLRKINAKSPRQVQQLLVKSPKPCIGRDAGARQQRYIDEATAHALEFFTLDNVHQRKVCMAPQGVFERQTIHHPDAQHRPEDWNG